MYTAERSGVCSIASYVKDLLPCAQVYREQSVALIEQIASPQWRGKHGEFETRPESHNIVFDHDRKYIRSQTSQDSHGKHGERAGN